MLVFYFFQWTQWSEICPLKHCCYACQCCHTCMFHCSCRAIPRHTSLLVKIDTTGKHVTLRDSSYLWLTPLEMGFLLKGVKYPPEGFHTWLFNVNISKHENAVFVFTSVNWFLASITYTVAVNSGLKGF